MGHLTNNLDAIQLKAMDNLQPKLSNAKLMIFAVVAKKEASISM